MIDTPERRLYPPEYPMPDFPKCPNCGSAAAEDFYFRDGKCLGCEKCIKKHYYLNVNFT